jgi:hypothetical protein
MFFIKRAGAFHFELLPIFTPQMVLLWLNNIKTSIQND